MILEKLLQNRELKFTLEMSSRSDQGLLGIRRPLIGKRFRSNPPPLPGGWRGLQAVAERPRRRRRKAGAIVRVGFALHRGFVVGYHLAVAPVTPRGLCYRAC